MSKFDGVARLNERAFGPSGGHRPGLARYQFGELAEVLGGGGKEELVFRSVWTSKTQAVEFQDTLEMCEQHLDLLPLAS